MAIGTGVPSLPDGRPAWRAWYKHARWQRLRQHQLTSEPLCRMCLEAEVVTEATVADHVVPHRGDPDLFWNGRLQSLCERHHNRDKQAEESGRQVVRFDAGGWPI